MVHERAQQNEDVRAIRPELRGGHEGGPHPQPGVTGGVLQGVAGLVAGDPDGGEGFGAVDARRQPQGPGGRIIMVAQHAPDLLDGHVLQALLVQQAAGGFRSRETG